MRVLRGKALEVLVTLVFFLLMASSGRPASKGAVQSSSPFIATAYSACTGEQVGLVGEINTVTRIRSDQGGVHLVVHVNGQGIQGFSSVGRTYRATRNMELIANGDGLPLSGTAVQSFNLVSEGRGANFLVHVTSHVTVNADGETTVDIVNLNEECGI